MADLKTKETFEVEAVRGCRTMRSQDKSLNEEWDLFIKWAGYEETENTWEPLESIGHVGVVREYIQKHRLQKALNEFTPSPEEPERKTTTTKNKRGVPLQGPLTKCVKKEKQEETAKIAQLSQTTGASDNITAAVSMPIQGVIDVVQAVRGAGIVPETYYREHCPYEQLKDEKDHRIQKLVLLVADCEQRFQTSEQKISRLTEERDRARQELSELNEETVIYLTTDEE